MHRVHTTPWNQSLNLKRPKDAFCALIPCGFVVGISNLIFRNDYTCRLDVYSVNVFTLAAENYVLLQNTGRCHLPWIHWQAADALISQRVTRIPFAESWAMAVLGAHFPDFYEIASAMKVT